MSDTISIAPTAANETSAKGKDHEGRFIWYELMTPDRDAALDFYREVVGWSAADFPGAPGGMRYTILSAGERGVAGLMEIDAAMAGDGLQPGWSGVIAVADVDAAAERLAEAGGRVLKAPEDIPTVGRFAIVADPGGAVFQLLAPEPMPDSPPPAEPDAPGAVGWHELYSSAGERRSFEFYSRLFGWETESEMDMGPMGKYRIFAKDGVALGGMMDKPQNVPASAWTFYFNVEGIDAAAERVKAKGGEVLTGPMEVPGGSWIIQGRDPQGVQFALVSPTR